MTSKQQLALGLVGLAAAAMLFCALTKQWYKIEYRTHVVKVGLLDVETCFNFGDKECKTESLHDRVKEDLKYQYNQKLKDNIETWLTASKLTFIMALLSVFALIGVGILGFLRHDKVALVGKLALLVLILTILCSIVLLAKKSIFLNASLGVFLFMFGGMAGVIGAQMLTMDSTYVEVERDPSIPRL